jgi:hypothetical protein
MLSMGLVARAWRGVGALSLAASLAACGAILGLPDRQLDPGDDAAADATTLPDGPGPNADVVVAADGGADAEGDASGGSDGCASKPEDCTNGVDDNCDGLVDCADPQCGAFACVDENPSVADAGADAGEGGVVWRGPAALAQVDGGVDAGALPACDGGFPSLAYEGNEGLSAPPALCGCACGAPSGVACTTLMQLFFDGDTNCNGAQCSSARINGSACASTGVTAGCENYRAASFPDGGACASSVDASVPAATWGASLRACALSSSSPVHRGGCGAGQVCAPRAAAPFGPKLCVVASGDVPCPGGYPARRLAHGGFTDTRGCSCACGARAGGSCSGGQLQLWNSSGCGGSPNDTTNLPETCRREGYTPDSVRINGTVTFSGGACPVTGGADGGTTPTQPTTICCAP